MNLLKDTNVTNQRYFIFLKIETEQEGRHEGFVGSVFFFYKSIYEQASCCQKSHLHKIIAINP